MSGAFGQKLKQLRNEREILQSAFAEQCGISSAYLSDIERGRRNPPEDQVILEWVRLLDLAQAEEIGRELIDLASRDRGRAEAVTETEVEVAQTLWQGTAGRKEESGQDAEQKKSRTPFLDYFGENLVSLARQEELDPAPGHAPTFAEIAVALTRRKRNSAVLTGASSAASHRVVQGLACEMAAGQVPAALAKKRLLTAQGIQAGVKYRGQFEERLKALTDEIAMVGDVILHVPSLADLVDLEGNAKGSILRVALQDGVVQVLTSATTAEMDYCRKTNEGLAECFQPVSVSPLDRAGVLRNLYAVRQRYGTHHGASYADEALDAIAKAAEAGEAAAYYQRALDLLDEVGARLRLEEGKGEATVEHVRQVTERYF